MQTQINLFKDEKFEPRREYYQKLSVPFQPLSETSKEGAEYMKGFRAGSECHLIMSEFLYWGFLTIAEIENLTDIAKYKIPARLSKLRDKGLICKTDTTRENPCTGLQNEIWKIKSF